MYLHPLSNKHIVYNYKRPCLVYTYMFGKHMSHAYIYVHIYVCIYKGIEYWWSTDACKCIDLWAL